jgi:hypothetical protein
MELSKAKQSNKVKDAPLPFSKANFQVIEQEKNLLKITLEYVAKENETLKQQLEDMKMTVKHNKDLLKEYIEKITSKDTVVLKMNSTIEQLTTRLHSLEEYIKNKYIYYNTSKLNVSIGVTKTKPIEKVEAQQPIQICKVKEDLGDTQKMESNTNMTSNLTSLTNATTRDQIKDVKNCLI